VSNWNPWKVIVKFWKKDEYLSRRDVLIWQGLNFLSILPFLLVVESLRHRPACWVFIIWLLIVGTALPLTLIPQVRARRVKRLNRRVDKKKSKTKASNGK
jgi:hypothetical protein